MGNKSANKISGQRCRLSLYLLCRFSCPQHSIRRHLTQGYTRLLRCFFFKSRKGWRLKTGEVIVAVAGQKKQEKMKQVQQNCRTVRFNNRRDFGKFPTKKFTFLSELYKKKNLQCLPGIYVSDLSMKLSCFDQISD